MLKLFRVRRVLTRQELLQLETLREVKKLMATWSDIKNDIEDLKREVAKLYDKMMEWKGKVAECMAKEHIDPAELQAVHDDIAGVVVDVESKLHADGG